MTHWALASQEEYKLIHTASMVGIHYTLGGFATQFPPMATGRLTLFHPFAQFLNILYKLFNLSL